MYKRQVLDIGGTSIKAGIYENGSLRDCREFATDAYLGGESVMRKAIGILKGCCGFERIGISTAGQVDSSAGVIRFAKDVYKRQSYVSALNILDTYVRKRYNTNRYQESDDNQPYK